MIGVYTLRNHKGYQDDGEYGAGYKITQLLNGEYPPNTAVYIARVYGGKQLGGRRFSCMKETVRQALSRAGIEPLNGDTSS